MPGEQTLLEDLVDGTASIEVPPDLSLTDAVAESDRLQECGARQMQVVASNGFENLLRGSKSAFAAVTEFIRATQQEVMEEMKSEELALFSKQLEDEKARLRAAHEQEARKSFQKLEDYDRMLKEYQTNGKFYMDLYRQEKRRHAEMKEELLKLNSNVHVIGVLQPPSPEGALLSIKGNTVRVAPPSRKLREGTSGSSPMREKLLSVDLNGVFTAETPVDVMAVRLKPFVELFRRGTNLCYIHYGTMNSGKYTLMHGDGDEDGLFFQTMEAIYASCRSHPEATYSFTSCIVELWSDSFFDLSTFGSSGETFQSHLSSGKKSSVRVSKDEIKGIRYVEVPSAEDLFTFYRLAMSNRENAIDGDLKHYSRSHLMITLKMSINHLGDVKRCIFHYCLLGSSDDFFLMDSKDFQQYQPITSSLACLGECLSLVAYSNPIIHYKKSKLTRYMRDCFKNECKVVMLLHLPNSREHETKVRDSLRFAEVSMNREVNQMLNAATGLTGRRTLGITLARGTSVSAFMKAQQLRNSVSLAKSSRLMPMSGGIHRKSGSGFFIRQKKAASTAMESRGTLM